MSNIKELTPEIEAKIPDYIKRALEGVFDGGRYNDFKIENAQEILDVIYKMCDFPSPKLFVAENPYEAQVIYHELLIKYGYKKREENIDYVNSYLYLVNVYSDAYYTFYKFIKDEFEIEVSGNVEKLDQLYELQKKSGIYSCIFTEEACILSKYPLNVERDDNNQLHNDEGVAVKWASSPQGRIINIPDENLVKGESNTIVMKGDTNWDCFYIHGRNIPSDFYKKVLRGEFTADDFIKEKNEELKAASYEILGSEKFIRMMDVEMIDSAKLKHNNEDEIVELYKTKFTLPETDNQPLAWVRFICPTTGSSYFIDVEPKFISVEQAVLSTSPFYSDGHINGIEEYKFEQRA